MLWMTNTKEPSKSEKKLRMTNPLKKAFHIWKKGNANASDEAWMCVLRASDPHYQKETI
jgi:Cu/Zn superoxide dismutase